MNNFEMDRFNNKNAKRKRKIEYDFVTMMKDKGVCGNVLALVGPALKEHYFNYKRITSERGTITVCEWDKKIFKYQNSIKEEYPRLRLHCTDIFKLLRKPVPPIALLDLDFTCSVESVVEQGFYRNMRLAFKNKKFKQTFAMIITCSQRCSYQSMDQLRDNTKFIAKEHDYSLIKEDYESYGDGQQMETRLFIFRVNPNKRYKKWIKQ